MSDSQVYQTDDTPLAAYLITENHKLLSELSEKRKKGELKAADRLKIPPQDIPEQKPSERIENVNEVAQGYTETRARLEALRCLQCKNAPCVQGCPVRIRIKDFISAIADGE